MTEEKKGWLNRQFELAQQYYDSLPQWKKDMIRSDN